MLVIITAGIVESTWSDDLCQFNILKNCSDIKSYLNIIKSSPLADLHSARKLHAACVQEKKIGTLDKERADTAGRPRLSGQYTCMFFPDLDFIRGCKQAASWT